MPKGERQERRGPLAAAVSWLTGLAFYILIFLVILGVYLFTAQSHGPRLLFGYSMFVVLTNSMQSEIPQASLVVVKSVDPNTIKTGDDITFMASSTATVTHKVVKIYEDYQQSGMRGFQTRGVENQEPDAAVVYADNVIGKVIFHNEALGLFLSWVKARIWLVAGLIAVLIAFIAVLRYLINVSKEPSEPPEAPVQEASGPITPDPVISPQEISEKPPDPEASVIKTADKNFDPENFDLEPFDPKTFDPQAFEQDTPPRP